MGPLTITCPVGAATLEGASRSGDYQIVWDGPAGATFRLIESADPTASPQILYEGPQRASTVTGRAQGDFFYQVGLVEAGAVTQWSEHCEVKVRPYPLGVAFTFFGLGLTVTLATVLVVVLGHRAHRRGELE